MWCGGFGAAEEEEEEKDRPTHDQHPPTNSKKARGPGDGVCMERQWSGIDSGYEPEEQGVIAQRTGGRKSIPLERTEQNRTLAAPRRGSKEGKDGRNEGESERIEHWYDGGRRPSQLQPEDPIIVHRRRRTRTGDREAVSEKTGTSMLFGRLVATFRAERRVAAGDVWSGKEEDDKETRGRVISDVGGTACDPSPSARGWCDQGVAVEKAPEEDMRRVWQTRIDSSQVGPKWEWPSWKIDRHDSWTGFARQHQRDRPSENGRCECDVGEERPNAHDMIGPATNREAAEYSVAAQVELWSPLGWWDGGRRVRMRGFFELVAVRMGRRPRVLSQEVPISSANRIFHASIRRPARPQDESISKINSYSGGSHYLSSPSFTQRRDQKAGGCRRMQAEGELEVGIERMVERRES
ncbi:hypothetical protein B0H19DRAFT_1077440 [Mycena capillaripes]|nr:hypothetical protein B0H19DRAFT_1077440 [Mycena capillaripes]